MSIDAVVSRRFAELDAQINGLPTEFKESGIRHYRPQEWQGWATSAHHIIRIAFGESSPHYRNFSNAYGRCYGRGDQLDALTGIFRAARADYDGGYTFSVHAAISGEIYGDFVSLAKKALAEDFKDVAAVLVCAALEDALKRFALMNDRQVSDKSMPEVVNALKSRGLVGGAQKTLLDTMPKIRDYAMHANWQKITPQDVGSVLGFVEQFLLTNFS